MGAPPGNYTVTAAVNGSTCDGPRQVTVPETGAVDASFTCTPVPAGGTVTVMVFGQGSPASGAQVQLVRSGTQTVEQTGTTAGNGQVQFTGVPAGSYSVTATLTGFVCNPTTVGVAPNGQHPASISCSSTGG
jgi:hypothetical protein